MDSIWLPKKKIVSKYPHIFTYTVFNTWYTPVKPHHEASRGIFGEASDLSLKELEEKILEAAYSGVIKPDYNIALRLGFCPDCMVAGVEWPMFQEPTNDSVDWGIIRKLKEKVPEFHQFREFYFMPTGMRLNENSHYFNELIVGHLANNRIPKGGEWKVRQSISFGNAAGMLGSPLPYERHIGQSKQPIGIPKLTD